jgi:hypothetical protein
MAPSNDGRGSTGSDVKAALAVVAALFIAGGALAGGASGAVLAVGLLGLIGGLVAIARGRAPSMSVLGRAIGWAAAATGLGALVVGMAMTPKTTTASSEQVLFDQQTAASPSGAQVAGAATTSAAPSTASSPATSLKPRAAAPVMRMTCPAADSGASPTFGHQIKAVGPYSVVIDYGDGDRYTNDDQHLTAVFTHTYAKPGTFTVSAVLTDATLQTTTATCAYSWGIPAAAASSSAAGGVGAGPAARGRTPV